MPNLSVAASGFFGTSPLSHVSEASRESSFHSEPRSHARSERGSLIHNESQNSCSLFNQRTFSNDFTQPSKLPHSVIGPASREDHPRIYVRSRIFIGGLTDNINEDDLRQLFAELCPGENVEILIKQRGSSQFRGYGFATFKSRQVADAAFAKGGGEKCSIKGVKLNISHAFRREDPVKLQQGQGRGRYTHQPCGGSGGSDAWGGSGTTYFPLTPPASPYAMPLYPYAYGGYGPYYPMPAHSAYSMMLNSAMFNGGRVPSVMTSPPATSRNSRNVSPNGPIPEFNFQDTMPSGRTSAMSNGSIDSNYPLQWAWNTTPTNIDYTSLFSNWNPTAQPANQTPQAADGKRIGDSIGSCRLENFNLGNNFNSTQYGR